MMESEILSFGDMVYVLRTDETRRSGIAGRTGMLCGFTTPSVTGLGVVGVPEDDLAFNVLFDEPDEDYWVAPALLRVVSRGAGQAIPVGDVHLVKLPDGTWVPEPSHGDDAGESW